MIRFIQLLSFVLILTSARISFAQEFKNLKAYEKETGKLILDQGFWLKKDRVNSTDVWREANRFNILSVYGNLKYHSISEIRDFYGWFDTERKSKGHEIITFGVAELVAGQLSYFDNSFIRIFIVNNKDVVYFGNEGSKRVFAYFFPSIKELYLSTRVITGETAKNWERNVFQIEQCEIVEPIYNELPAKAIKKLERMAKGKLIYKIKVKRELRYEGDIKDCESRYIHAFVKLRQFYLSKEL